MCYCNSLDIKSRDGQWTKCLPSQSVHLGGAVVNVVGCLSARSMGCVKLGLLSDDCVDQHEASGSLNPD